MYMRIVLCRTITGTSPASNYVGIEQSITYGTNTQILSTTAGITDTGTTLLLLATDAFNKYKKATGAKEDSTTGLLKISSSQYKKLKSLFFNIGGVSAFHPPLYPVPSTHAPPTENLRVHRQRSDLASLGTSPRPLIALFARVSHAHVLTHLYVAQQRSRRRLQQHLPRRRRPRLEQRRGPRLHQRLLVGRAVLHRVRCLAEPGRLRHHSVHVRDHQLKRLGLRCRSLFLVCTWDCIEHTLELSARCRIPSVLSTWKMTVCCNPRRCGAVHCEGFDDPRGLCGASQSALQLNVVANMSDSWRTCLQVQRFSN